MDGRGALNATREDRIKQRRLAIEKKKAKRESAETKTTRDVSSKAEDLGHGKKQTQSSLAHIDKVKAHSIEEVTTIRVEADNTENRRRIVEEDKRQERLRRLQEEAITSGKRNAAVEMRWPWRTSCNASGGTRPHRRPRTTLGTTVSLHHRG